MVDAIVVGAGPNGMVAAATLARHGWSVLLLEAKSRPGGALYSEERTLPGYVHDVGAAFFPFAEFSPAFRSLDLDGTALEWRNARRESCHPAPDGTSVAISRDLQLSMQSFGPDGPAWERLARWQQAMQERLANALLAPLPAAGTALRLGLRNLITLALAGVRTPGGYSRHCFATEAARRVIPGLALHVDLGPNDFSGAGLGLILALLASSTGFRVPVGGARSITQALLRRLEEAGGAVRLNSRVQKIVVQKRRAVALTTEMGDEIGAARAILVDVGAPALFCKLLPESEVCWWVRRSMR